jgi:hypothetical protein
MKFMDRLLEHIKAHMKRFAMTIGVLILSGCTHSTVLVNPKTGERVKVRWAEGAI